MASNKKQGTDAAKNVYAVPVLLAHHLQCWPNINVIKLTLGHAGESFGKQKK